MISLRNVHKSYRTFYGWKHVLKGISIDIPKDKSLGILGRNGAGKSTLIKLLSRLEMPDKGEITTGDLRMSWPIGGGGVQSTLSGRDNVRFICRVYALDIEKTVDFVNDFAELGKYIDMPVSTYSAGMRARLAFAISMATDYDCYLVDEGFSAGDARFTNRMSELFEQRRQRSNMIVVSHSGRIIKKFCDFAAILENGLLTVYDSVDEAFERYKKL